MDGGVDRRGEIAAACIRILAADGVRALTHRAVDRDLELPPGSTSYYARSRRALMHLAAVELAARAHAQFTGSGLREPTTTTAHLGAVAEGIAQFMDRMLSHHHDDIVARYALALEVQKDDELSRLLATATFSQPAAEGLMRALAVTEPADAAADLISLLEGLLLDHVLGRRRPKPPTARRVGLRRAVHHLLLGLPRDPAGE